MVDGGLTSIPWEDLDPTLVQAIQRESDGLALGDLEDRLRPQDAIEAVWGASPIPAAQPVALFARPDQEFSCGCYGILISVGFL